MGKIFSIIVFLIATSLAQADIPENMPQSIYDQIIQKVIQDKGYLDMSAVQEGIAQWQLQQPLPPTDGILVETGNCTTCSADTQGTSAQFKKPRNIKVKARRHANGKYPSVLKIRWLKPKKLKPSIRSQYKVSHYLIYISKGGQSYEVLKKKARYFKNGKLKKHQRIKFKDRSTGSYEVQVQAVYKLKTATAKSAQKNINKGASTGYISPWSPSNSFETQNKYTTVGQYTGAINTCLNNNGFVDATLLTAVDPSIDCTGYNLQNADIDLMANLTNIRSIIIANNPAVTDISALANLNYLEYLDLSNNPNIALPDFSLFSELTTLKLANMGLTTVPDLSTNDLLTALDLNDNAITSGFDLLPNILEVLDAKGAATNPCDTIPGGTTIDSLTLSGPAITSIESCANVSGLRYLTVNDAPNLELINGGIGIGNGSSKVSVSIDNFAGFCGLTFNNTNLEILEGSRPINRLNLIDNTNLQQIKTIKPAYNQGTNSYPDLIPASVRIQGSDSMDCSAIYEKKTFKETLPILQMQGKSVFTKVNGVEKNSKQCPYTAQADAHIFPNICKPDPIQSLNIYQDTNTQRRYITWEKNPNHDYTLWGVTHYKIQGFVNGVNGTVVYQRNIAINTVTTLLQNSLEADTYTISVCTEQECSEPITQSAPFAQGLTRVIDTSTFWNTSGLDPQNFTYRIRFKYPNFAFNTQSGVGKPTYFKIIPDFPQDTGALDEIIIPVIDPNQNGNCIQSTNGNDNSCNGDAEIWVSQEIDRNLFVGNNFTITACNELIGCGGGASLNLGNPLTDSQLPVPIWTIGDQTVNIGTEFTLSWDASILNEKIVGTDDYLVDYLEVSERQPYISSNHLYGVPASDYAVNVFYIDRGKGQSFVDHQLISRVTKGSYDFILRACHRDRVLGDSCSYNSTWHNVTLNRFEVGTPPTPTNVNFVTYSFEKLDANGNIITVERKALVWDKMSGVDYFYIAGTNTATGSSSPVCLSTVSTFSMSNDSSQQYSVELASGQSKEMLSNVGSCIAIVDIDEPEWTVQACNSGLGCNTPSVPLQADTPAIGTIENPFPISTTNTPDSVGGPGDMNPGSWWNPMQNGTGWHFYWASELRYPSVHERYGNTYDLLGVWYTYKLVDDVWTPIWIFSHLKETQVIGNAKFFEGSLNYFTRIGGVTNSRSIGRLQVYFGVQSGDNNIVRLNIDLDSGNGIISQDIASIENRSDCNDYYGYDICIIPDGNGSINIPLINFDVTVEAEPSVYEQTGNNADHYSGLWWDERADGTINEDYMFMIDVNKGLEWRGIISYDNNGDPIWAVSSNCVNNHCSNSQAGYMSMDFRTVYTGFNPLMYAPEGYAVRDSSVPVGSGSRTLNSPQDLREIKLGKTDLSITSASLPSRGAGASLSIPANTILDKGASFHDIRFFINGNDESVTTCDPNVDGECVVKFTWYTDDYFPSIEPYYKRGTGPYLPLSGLCGNATPTDVFVVTDYQCTITVPGTYTFQLRKENYDTGIKDVVIAESQDLEVIECNGDCTMPITPILSVPGPIVDVGFYTVSWSSSPNATRYVLEESIDAVNWTEVYVGNNLDVLIKDKVVNGATYYYKIKACNNEICSPYSPVTEVTIIFNCSNAPSVPDSGDFIQEMESSVASLNRTSFSNKSVIPELAEFKIPETYILGVPNEKINILNASVTYEYNDVVIPGSNGLDLIVKRELGTFEMVSKVEGFKVEYCSGAMINDRLSVFIEGKSLISVGFASSADVPTGTLVAYREGYFLRCNQQDNPEVIAPDGKTYTFGKTLDNGAAIPFSYFVTEVKDEFNNAINFNYGEDFPYYCTNFLNLESMSRNDGAQIDFEYVVNLNLPFISKVKYGGREVNYNYEFVTNIGYKWKLTSFVDQENRTTTYEYYSAKPLLKNVTMPSGLNVEYQYNKLNPGIDGGFSDQLTDRIISGSDIPTNRITYFYGEGEVNHTNLLITQRFDDYALIRRIAFRDSALIDPNANNELHSDYVLIGTIKSDTYLYDDDPVSLTNPLEVLYSETNLWSPYRFGGEGCPQINDAPVGGTNDYFRICARPLLLKKTFSYQVKDGATNSYDTYVNEYLNYDKYGYPSITKQSKVNSTTNNRYVKQFYNHDTQNWILGQPTITQVSSDNINWTETNKNSYWSATGSYKSKLKYQYQYGQLNKYYQQYNTSGDLQRVNTSGTNYYEIYSNYKRGIAQTYTIPKRYTIGTQNRYKTVNDFGEIVSETDYIGITADYTYDKLGRIKLIDYNQCDIPANCTYQNDVFTYSDSPNITTKTKGNYLETKTYDVLGRIKLESTQDITDSTTEVTKSYIYGINGTLDYQSLPSNALNATGGNGIEYEYDFLNRKTKETVFDSSRVTIRDFEYLKNNKVRITDGNGYKTTVEYLSFGSSTYSNPINISQQVTSTPTYVNTAINYNLFDNISTITQGGITETRLYDSYQQLCKVRRPDVGVTSYGYYSSGLLNWLANGTTGDTNDCLGVTASDKITYTYNNQNELWTKSDANGTVLTTTTSLTNNVGTETNFNTDTTHLTFNYNTRGQLVTKAMDVAPFNLGSPGSGVTSWTYDDMGYTSTMTYPESDSILTYTNNALGQVTSIAESAGGANGFSISAISYHPSGGLLSYTLGNGVTHTTTRTNSGLPASMTDSKGAATLFAHSYAYDNESNLSNLIDGVDPAYNLSAITYDGLNRLKTLTGNWGATNFNYDNLSNITQMKLGAQTLNYVYGATNNRLESTTGSAAFSFQYDSSGNITNNGFRVFDYDKQNRLVTSENVSFIHDGEDLIHSKSVVGEPTKYSLYGANQNILYNFESNGDGTVYYYLNDISVANVKITGTTRTLTYQHNDALGSLAVETNASGTVTKRYHYEPYGFTLEAGQADSLGFTGQIYDDDLGLNYMKARYYDPMIGRFYSNDPIGFDVNNPMSFNRFSYANNNPYKYVDKTGENIVLWIGGIGSGVIDFAKGEGFNKDGNLTGALGDGYTNGNIGGALLEDASNLVPAAKAAKYAGKAAGKVGEFFKKFFKKKCCFVAGTQVLTKDGYKNIENVKLAELVWAKNVETGKSDWKPVSKIYIEHNRDIYNLKLKKNDGQIINIQTTDDHPFYTKDHVWKTTIELQVGDYIETKEIGNVKVVEVIDEKREDITYNFEIADFHTYYVTEFGVLVHNCNKTDSANQAAQKGKRAKQSDDALQNLEEIENAQRKVRSKKSGQIIDQIDKSKQRVKHVLKNIDIDKLDDF